MIESAHGIVLRRRPLTETSLIIHWLTRDLGRIATVAKGARRNRSPFSGKLDLFYEADLSFTRSRTSDLHTLREVRLQETNQALREDLFRLNRAAYACAFIEQATETETPLTAIFDLLQDFLKAICRTGPPGPIVFAFELKLLGELGLAPDLSEAHLTAGTRKIMTVLAEKNFTAIEPLKLTPLQTEELRRFLHGFLIFHLGKLPKGRAAALSEN